MTSTKNRLFCRKKVSKLFLIIHQQTVRIYEAIVDLQNIDFGNLHKLN